MFLDFNPRTNSNLVIRYVLEMKLYFLLQHPISFRKVVNIQVAIALIYFSFCWSLHSVFFRQIIKSFFFLFSPPLYFSCAVAKCSNTCHVISFYILVTSSQLRCLGKTKTSFIIYSCATYKTGQNILLVIVDLNFTMNFLGLFVFIAPPEIFVMKRFSAFFYQN